MVDFQVPLATLDQYRAFIKLCHVMSGLYIWEFFTTLGYEWSIIQGRRPYRWTIWIYSFTRLGTLMSVMLSLVSLDTARPINCQVLITFTFVFGYLAISAALLLIVLRNIAIWNKNKIVIALTTSAWATHLACIIQGVSQLHSTWLPVNTCSLPDMERDKLTLIIMLATDVVMVLTMFFGLLRLRGQGTGMFGLARLLWKQGVIWLFFSTGAGLTTVLLNRLDLTRTPPLNIMFLTPTMISMSVTATRICTSLADFGSADVVMDSDLERGRRAISNAKRMPVVHVACEPQPTSQSATLSLNMSGRLCDKPQGLSAESL